MIIVKEGTLPKGKNYEGECEKCGCVVHCGEGELNLYCSGVVCDCPTVGCKRMINLHEQPDKYVAVRSEESINT